VSSTSLASPPSKTDGLLARFRAELAYYARVVLRIQTKSGTTIPFEFNRAQEVLQAKISAQLAERGFVRALVLKARQVGISTFIAARIYRGTTLHANRRALVVADKDEHSEALYAIYGRFYDHSPLELRPAKRTSRRGQEMEFNRPDGQGLDSQIAVDSAGGRAAGRSLTRWYLHLSEVAFWPEQFEALTGLLQTVPLGAGEVYLESTANGVGDEFHARWVAAIEGGNDWLAIFLPWWIDATYALPCSEAEVEEIRASTDPWEREALRRGIEWEGERWKLAPEQLKWRRSKITTDFAGDVRSFRQEFPSTWREAFVVSGNAYFDEEALLDYEARTQAPIMRGNFISLRQGQALRPAERGYVQVWEAPDPKGHYVIAGDTASGILAAARDTSLSDPDAERGGRDFCSADVLKVSEEIADPSNPKRRKRVACLRQVAQIHGRMAPEVFAQQTWGAAVWWSCQGLQRRRWPALTAIERNHDSGQTTIRLLRETYRHPKLYAHRQMNVREGKPTIQVGWITDGQTRMPMLDELAGLIRQGRVEVNSADTVREMLTFVRADDGKPQAQEGTHDDRVISLAIGVQMGLHHHSDGPSGKLPEPETPDTPTGT
jgi:hypothetical protein